MHEKRQTALSSLEHEQESLQKAEKIVFCEMRALLGNLLLAAWLM